jgi:hypothetical protein
MYELLIAIILCSIFCIFSICWVNSAHKRKKERLHQELRDNACAERDRQIQEAIDKGHFEQWGQDKSPCITDDRFWL